MIEPNIEKLSIGQGMFLQDYRLTFLKAVEAGNKEKVEELLEKMPELIKVQTKTLGSSSLHIAAENNHEDICQLLLDKNHETNPIDKKGKTPYQVTKSNNIKKLLAKQHKKFLCGKYYTASQIATSKKPLLNIVVEESQTMDYAEYDNFISKEGLIEKSFLSVTFGATRIYPEGLSTVTSTFHEDLETNTLFIKTFFREDTLMLPYFGDLRVIEENALAINFMETLEKHHQFKDEEKKYWENIIFPQKYSLLEKIQDPTYPSNLLTVASTHNPTYLNQIPELRAHASLAAVSKGLEIFPFLENYPQQNDTPEIREAKKMFVTFLLARSVQCLGLCTKDTASRIQLNFVRAAKHVANVITSKENKTKNRAIALEMTEKYLHVTESELQQSATKSNI